MTRLRGTSWMALLPPDQRKLAQAAHGSSEVVEKLQQQLQLAGVPRPQPELRFHEVRKWRFDLAWPEHRVAVEVDGGVYAIGEDGQQGGRHQRPAGFENDCEKLSTAAAMGWRVLKVSPSMVRSGLALQLVEQALRWSPEEESHDG